MSEQDKPLVELRVDRAMVSVSFQRDMDNQAPGWRAWPEAGVRRAARRWLANEPVATDAPVQVGGPGESVMGSRFEGQPPPRPQQAKRVIRVLIYEGPEDRLRADLQKRGIKGGRNTSPINGITILERFVEHQEVVEWLGEKVTASDIIRATRAADEMLREAAMPTIVENLNGSEEDTTES